MSDDSFIREVNEELRQDQMKALWRRYGAIAIAVAVAVVLATAAYVGYEYWRESRANASGDAFSEALELAEQGATGEALAALETLEAEGFGAYPLLARMRAATVLAADGQVEEAVAAFDAVAGDGAIADSIRDMARLRAALLLVDHGSYADVAARVETLTGDANPLRHSAREALGLAAWKEGRRDDALALFEQIADDPRAPANLRRRAELMNELIVGSGPAA
ncbi:tetratricopeptide repeat protein [Aquibium sp. A9E412]|uniref:tetratricopeptide repeat protein n=1 Tax=Aquibium sp. A9E412 TaxID=2976767 RepID=UPI0025AF59D8|nr:tetratricopeptide repeat protein [Aquibium sp. A9E412]MDN2566733.1 tetratricopeptide repeat protein [Aquibium sp. A9E412]